MGVVNDLAQKGLSAIGGGAIFQQKTNTMSLTPDFPGGFVIQELVNGKPSKSPRGRVVLLGSFMPTVPFEFGGKQKIAKDYYPGNSEPVVQMLGGRENDVTIHGHFKTKKFQDPALKDAAIMYQKMLDDMRERGNLVQITLGNWMRYAVIEDASFKMNRLTDIEYTLAFSVISRTKPKECKTLKEQTDDVKGPTEELMSAVTDALLKKRYPDSMPRTLADFVTGLVSLVASTMNNVTGFISGALSDINALVVSANRATGLIRNARATIFRTLRQIGSISLAVSNLTAGIGDPSRKSSAQAEHSRFLLELSNILKYLGLILATLQLRFAALSKTVPMVRHIVKASETLQQISNRYYNNPDQWKRIYDHNKLSSSKLSSGTILEIPKL